MAPEPRSELQELVDAPSETLEVEYKEWLDGGDGVVRADLARHIAALANHGGGRIVIGIKNDMTSAGANPYPTPALDHDCIASIVKKYLEPPFHCTVEVVASTAGVLHPIITVPPHGTIPICAKSNGPELKGKVVGISQGTYYIRKPGPESAPIMTAIEWGPLIRRCAMHDRNAVLGAIEAVLKARPSAAAPSPDELKVWHDAARNAFLCDLRNLKDFPPTYEKAQITFSYRVLTQVGQRLTGDALAKSLREVNNEVRDLVRTGWSMFYVFDRAGIQPAWKVDPASGEGDTDFLECSLLRDPILDWTGCDLWRVTTGAKAALVREYWEDEAEWCKSRNLQPGTGFDPHLMLRCVAELVRHGRGMAERFPSATDIEFRCEWNGLAGRKLISERGAHWSHRQPPTDPRRVSVASAAVASLALDWPRVVSQLATPVARLFGIEQHAAAEAILQRSQRWNVF